ncbi:MAG: hypothetical protein AAFW70_16390 [Cyanobacteria bacterium J06635_10]
MFKTRTSSKHRLNPVNLLNLEVLELQASEPVGKFFNDCFKRSADNGAAFARTGQLKSYRTKPEAPGL